MLAAVVMSAGLAMAATAPKAAPKAAKPAAVVVVKPAVKPAVKAPPKFVGRAWTAKPKAKKK